MSRLALKQTPNFAKTAPQLGKSTQLNPIFTSWRQYSSPSGKNRCRKEEKAHEDSLTMRHSKLYVRAGLQQATLDALDAFLAQRGPNGQTLSNTVKYTFTFDVKHDAALPRDKGEWTAVVRVDFASPRAEPDGHGGTPHAQISSCLGPLVTKDDGTTYRNTQNFKDKADTLVLDDADILKAVDTGRFTPKMLDWLADRLLTKAPFQFVNLPGELQFRKSERDGS